MTPATHTDTDFVAWWPIDDEGMDMRLADLRESAGPDLADLLHEHRVQWDGEPVWTVEDMRDHGLCMVVRGPVRPWVEPRLRVDGRPMRTRRSAS